MQFQEKQRLNLWWLYILLGFETIIIGCVLFLDKGGITMAELERTYFAPVFALALPYVIIYFVTRNTLTVQLDSTGLTYRYWPFSRQKSISWTGIDKMYLRKYDALGEYGGWGVKHRLWFKMKDKAYIFNDENVGLQLELSNGRKLLFSTLKADELQLFLINLKRNHLIGAIETDVR
ncbi:MAG: hypothetical protein EOO90_08755 [Pedobacter sp.]|nr:MAG: hypothetical protein EOO90_08755 [Pedobacter sp.]